MAFKALERFEASKRELEAEERRREKTHIKREGLRAAVRDLIPKKVKDLAAGKIPVRPKGRTPIGGLTKKEVAALRTRAKRFLEGAEGLRALEAEVQLTAVVILLIDGVIGTEPWRAAGAPHGGVLAANARLRYLENAARLLEDLRRVRGGEMPLLEGVLDAGGEEPVDAELTAPALPESESNTR